MHSIVPKFVPTFDNPNQSATLHNPTVPRRNSFQPLSPNISPSHSPSPTDTIDDDNLPSPLSPSPTNHYHYAIHSSAHSLYDSAHNSSSYSFTSTNTNASNTYPVVGQHHSSSRDSADPPHPQNYLSDSPSPVDIHPSAQLTPPLSAPHFQHQFSTSSYHSHSSNYRYLRTNGASISKYAHAHLDHRRMSEPALFNNSYASPTTDAATGRLQQFHFANHTPHRVSSLHRGLSTGSLRELHQHQQQQQQQFEYSSPNPPWKTEDDHHPHHAHSHSHHSLESYSGHSDEPVHHNFPANSPQLGMTGIQYSSIAEDPYGPSPPGTGTSTSSNGPLTVTIPRPPLTSDLFPSHNRSDSRTVVNSRLPHSLRNSDQPPRIDRNNPSGTNGKTYSFVSLPGNAVKKRPRRRYDEIERLYQCSWPECNKAYGTLNHLNAHVTMQKHGQKRSPNEFKELRKQWRKAKKETDEQTRSKSRSIGIPPIDPRASAPAISQTPHANSTHGLEYPQHALGLATVSVPLLNSDGRYNGLDVPMDEIRFPLDDRERFAHHGELERERDFARQRYATGTPTAWHHSTRPLSNGSSGAGSAVGYDSQTQHTPPSQHPAHAHGHHLSPSQQQQQQQTVPNISRLGTDVMMNRLPADSTLLTPLPGYEPPALLPPLGENEVDAHQHHPHPQEHGDLMYNDDFNGAYDEDQKPTELHPGAPSAVLQGPGQHLGGRDYEL